MNLFGLMETSGSAMQAERIRAEVVAANMANAETTRTATGGPYQRQHVVFAANPADAGVNGAGTTGFLESLARASGMAVPAAPKPLPLLGAGNAHEPAGGVHIAQVVADPSPALHLISPRAGRSRENQFTFIDAAAEMLIPRLSVVAANPATASLCPGTT